ncbi:cupin domain-containing protein [Arenibacter sp. N53]|uniref:cupin domain-containing protein n=1 Tax=Arenibacter TaxID=178469 RepID=UPI000CD465A3|nr:MULTISPECIES: cupin domain-containing protein [Arenibacter]MCM4153445.1 cupin domain-containing protein [Arenibacter sp. N53]
MQRNSFIAALSAIATVPLLSFSSMEKVIKRKTEGFKINAGEGRVHGHIKLKGVNSNILDVKISGSDTDNDLAIFEQTSLSQGKGTPLHIHPGQDEIFYVLEGAYYFKVGDQTYNLSVGDSIFLPRKVPHAWTQVTETGKMMVIVQPAGKLENFFVAMSALDHEPGPKEIEQLFAENEMQVVGPPLKID